MGNRSLTMCVYVGIRQSLPCWKVSHSPFNSNSFSFFCFVNNRSMEQAANAVRVGSCVWGGGEFDYWLCHDNLLLL